MGAEWQTARAVGEQLLNLAQCLHDSGLLLEAHRALGFTLLCLGELASARADLEQGIALYDPAQHHTHAFLYGQNPGMSCRIYAAWTLWLLGYPKQALSMSHEALAMTQEQSHPFSAAWALNESARIRQYRREVHMTREQAEATITLSTEQGFAFTLACGRALWGWALAAQAAAEEGVVQICQGLATYRAIGTETFRPYFLALLAEAQGKAGRTEKGLSVLAEALTLVDNTGERYYQAELYRLKGELLLMQTAEGDDSRTAPPDASMLTGEDVRGTDRSSLLSEAAACFRRALDVAHQQQAKSLELRAAPSLSRLWLGQGLVYGLLREMSIAIARQETVGACAVAVLAAVNAGLGACLHMAGMPDKVDDVKRILKVPETWEVVWLQLVGYPAEDWEAGGQRSRLPFDQLFFDGEYGRPLARDEHVVEELRREGLLRAPMPKPGRFEELKQLAQMLGYPV
jgi:tetratricopeptide (TPR) repeat protein